MIRSSLHLTIAVLAATSLCACSTLSGQVRTSAVEFSAVMEEFSNQVLVTNVLRARDRSPLNFSDLPAITGSLSLKTSATLTVPFGPRNPTDGRNSVSPMIEFASTPTFDTTSLNTQAFTLGLLQPVSPVYIESIWNSGVSKSVLLFLFVESIQPPPGSKSEALYRNNPDDIDAFDQFKSLVAELAGRADLHSLTILEPVGLPIAIQTSCSASAPCAAPVSGAASAPPRPVALADIEVDKYLPLLQLEPNQFRTVVVVDSKGRHGMQVYRRYPSQVVLCTDPAVFSPAQPSSNPSPSALARQILGTNRQRMLTAPPFELLAAPLSPRKVERSDGGGGFRGVSLSNGTSAVIDKDQCKGSEQIADAAAGTTSDPARSLGHVRWRSTAEMFAYLGAVLRRSKSDNPVAWGGGVSHTLFNVEDAAAVQPPRVARINVNYLGSFYSVGSRSETIPPAPEKIDHSLEVLSLLSQLVNAAKHSEDTPAPRTLQVLP